LGFVEEPQCRPLGDGDSGVSGGGMSAAPA
jgi:hypothetical protein